MKAKEWGHAAKIVPRPDYNSPLFWGHACAVPKELFKTEKASKKTTPLEKWAFRISLLDRIEEALFKSKCPMELTIQDEKQIRWSWDEDEMSETQKFRSIALLIIPALEEALEDFKKTLQKQQNYESGRMSDPTAVLNSTRLQFFQNCLDQINNTVDKNFSKEEYPLDDLEYLVSWALTIAHNTETIYKEEPEISALPNFEDLRKEISEALLEGEKNPDPRIREWTSLEESVNQSLPKAFRIIRNDRGKARMENTPEWNEAREAGQEKLLIWTLEQAIIPGIDSGIKKFREKVAQKSGTDQGLINTLSEESITQLEQCMEALDQLEYNTRIAKEHLQSRNPEAFEKSFKEHLRLKAELKKEISNTPIKPETANRLMLLKDTLRGVQSEMRCSEAFATTIRTHLLRNLHQTLAKLQMVTLKTPSIDWEYQRTNPHQEKAKPIVFPPLGVDVPGFLDIPDLHRGFELAAQDFSDES